MKQLGIALLAISCIALTSCASQRSGSGGGSYYSYYDSSRYESRLPQQINTHERTVLVDPSVNAWGAYDSNGNLVRGGIATAGDSWCEDIGRPCRTATGTFRIQRMGDGSCKSKIYPRPNGGGLMPYCMFFSGGMALHGSPDGAVVEDNISHGCVRMRIPDAEWLRNDFASVGTKVIVKSY